MCRVLLHTGGEKWGGKKGRTKNGDHSRVFSHPTTKEEKIGGGN